MTPTTISATGEVATVYTLVPNNAATQASVISNNGSSVAGTIANHNNQTSTASTVLYTSQLGSEATYTAVPPSQPTQYYLMEVSGHQTQATTPHTAVLSTTKPYAVVNAIPATTQQPLIIKSPPPPPASLKIPPPTTASRTITTGRHSRKSTTPHHYPQRGSSSTTPPTMERVTYNHSKEEASSEIAHHLEQLSHKYRECQNLSEEKLMEIFQDAWNKFQTNGKKYEQYVQKRTPDPTCMSRSPNMEVVSYSSVPVQMSRQYNYSRSNKYPTSTAPLTVTSPVTTGVSLLPNKQVAMKNITNPQTIAGNNTNDKPQQHIPQQQQPQRTCHSNGVFIPPPQTTKQTVMTSNTMAPPRPGRAYLVADTPSTASTHSCNIVRRAATGSPSQEAINAKSQLHTVVHQGHHQQQQRVLVQQVQQQQRIPGPKVVKMCALCKRSATYLCSGCQKEWYCSRNCQVRP